MKANTCPKAGAWAVVVLALVACDHVQLPGHTAPTPEPGAATPAADTGAPEPEPTTLPGITITRRQTEAESLEVLRKRAAQDRPSEERPAAATPKPALRYDGPATASSPVLGLAWQREAAGVFSSEDAVAYCNDLVAAGNTDWRLPTITELEKVSATGFVPSSRMPVPSLWSATAHPVRGTWAFDLNDGLRVQLDATVAHAICVRQLP